MYLRHSLSIFTSTVFGCLLSPYFGTVFGNGTEEPVVIKQRFRCCVEIPTSTASANVKSDNLVLSNKDSKKRNCFHTYRRQQRQYATIFFLVGHAFTRQVLLTQGRSWVLLT